MLWKYEHAVQHWESLHGGVVTMFGKSQNKIYMNLYLYDYANDDSEPSAELSSVVFP